MKKLLAATAILLAIASNGYAADNAQGKLEGYRAHKKEQLAKLPAEKRTLVEKALEEGREARKASREDFKKLHEEVRTILTAPTFDKSAYLAKTKQLQELMEKNHTAMTERFAEIATKLNQEERKILADILPGKHKGNWGKKPVTENAPEADEKDE